MLEALRMSDVKKQSESERTVMSLSISLEDKKKLKLYALQHDKTVAAVIHEWIEKYCSN